MIPHIPETFVRCRKMKLLIFFCLSQILLGTLVCADHGGPHDDKGHDHHDHHHAEPKTFLQIAPANMLFGYNFYSHLSTVHPNDNLFFSPLSISVVFSLLALGARSKTLSQIREGFGFNMSLTSEEAIHNGFQQLLKFINHPKSDLKLNSANALFIDNKAKILDTFLEGAKKQYHSEAISTDFQDAKGAVQQINSYVEKKTEGKIKDLFDNLDPATTLVIVNTLVFKGMWKNPFNVNHTREEDFHVDEDTVVKVAMMTTQGEYLAAFVPKDGYTVIDVPYKGNTSALFILPDKGKLQDVTKTLLNVSLEALMQKLKPMDLILSIPKFSISHEIDLMEELPHLGVTDLFSDHADLSGITGDTKMKVSKAVHKAMLKIDEEGTEASAATGIGIAKTSLPPHIYINKPFLLGIIDKEAACVLFGGRITNPTK